MAVKKTTRARRGKEEADSEKPEFSSEDLKEAKKALFRAVEQPSNPHHDKDNEEEEEEHDNPQQHEDDNDNDDLVTLFTKQRCGAAVTNPKEQKELLCRTVEAWHSHEIRRFCTALVPRVEQMVASEVYVPTSVRQQEDDDDEAKHYDENNDEDQPEPKVLVKADAKSSRALQYLRLTSLCLQTYLDAKTNKEESKAKSNNNDGNNNSSAARRPTQVPEEFMQVVTALHQIIIALDRCGGEGKTTQAAIVHLCESIWHAQVPDRALVAPETFTVILLQALEQGSTARRWTRLFELRHVLTFLDWEDASTEWLRVTLLRLASDPFCLKHAHGKRFLAFMLQLEPDHVPPPPLVDEGYSGFEGDNEDRENHHYEHVATTTLHILSDELHQAIKVQVPTAKTSMLQAYGEIYWRAWKETDDPAVQRRLEATVWQDWVYAAIHLQQPATVKAVRLLLTSLHVNAKSNDAGAELLHRLYGPVLWRSLRATNAVVRTHAAHCLAAVFPLTTPTRVLPAMTQACDALQALLEDSDDRVRVAGVQAAGRVLGVYWDAIPTPTLRTILNILVAKLASDAPNATVRASVLTSIAQLLEFQATHAVLRPLLPLLGNLIHDRVSRVRLEAVRLLLQVKRTPGLKYFHVVPVHHLLARLASEGASGSSNSAVAQGLTALMLNSYLPSDPMQAVQRTVRFVRDAPDAAKVFYAHVAAANVPANQVVKLALLLWNALVAAILDKSGDANDDSASQDATKSNSKQSQRKRLKTRNQSIRKKEEEEVESPKDKGPAKPTSAYAGLVSTTDVNLWGGIAEIVSTLWGSIEDQLDQSDYNECKESLMESFSGQCLSDVLSRLEEGDDTSREYRHQTTAAILHCAGRLPAEAVEDLVVYIAKVLESKSSSKVNLSAHVALLCLWDKTEQVAPVLASSLDGTSRSLFRKNTASPESGEAPLIPQLPASVALDILTNILRGSDPSSVAARESILQSTLARSAVAQALERGLHKAELLLTNANVLTEMPHNDLEHVLKLCELFGRFALHAQAVSDDTTLNEYAETLLHWTSHTVAPVLADKQAVFEDTNISRISMDQSFRLPLSPFSEGPRRRTNRNKTPNLQGSESPKINNALTTSMQQNLAISLLRNNCLLFAEWLAVGRPGASMIAQAASTVWSAAMSLAQDKLLPAFMRLAVQLIKASHDSTFLREILVICRERESTVALKTGLEVLLSTRGYSSSEVLQSTVRSIVEALQLLCEKTEVQPTDSLPTSTQAAWPYTCGAMASALTVLTTHPKGQYEFTKASLHNLAERSEKFRIVTMNFIFVLLSSEDTVSDELAKLVRDIQKDTLDAESRAIPLIQELQDAVTA